MLKLAIKIGLFGFVVLMGQLTLAAVLLPSQMTQSDRQEALRILGLGSSAKILSDPYPLGGYSGFEFGLELDNLPTDSLSRLGSHLESSQEDITYPKLTVGKGLYDNLDLFVQLAPYNSNDQISQYGAIGRWGFYQAAFLPLSASLVLNLNSANFANQMTTWTYGADLIGGIDVNQVSLYAGIGLLKASGYFIGGTAGITDSGNIEKESVSGLHTMVGATVHVTDYFVSVELDRYTIAVLSGKVGMRF